MKEKAKKLLYLYERSFFYLSQAYAELHKPLVLLNESLMIITMLKVYGINLGWMFYATVFLILNIIGIIAGKIISWMGIIHYNTSLGNVYNPELQGIIERLGTIEGKIEKLKPPI